MKIKFIFFAILVLLHDWSVEGTLNPNLAGCTGQLSERPCALTAKVEPSSITDGKGLAQISMRVVDEKGIPYSGNGGNRWE
jgi:hypothetical protein